MLFSYRFVDKLNGLVSNYCSDGESEEQKHNMSEEVETSESIACR